MGFFYGGSVFDVMVKMCVMGGYNVVFVYCLCLFMIDYLEIFYWFLFVMFIGCVIGIDCNLCGKLIGMKILGLVVLGLVLVMMVVMDFLLEFDVYSCDVVSCVIQGVIIGIGFFGVGVIIYEQCSEKVCGLIMVVLIWVIVVVGIVCGVGWWCVVLMVMGLILILFVVGCLLEYFLYC